MDLTIPRIYILNNKEQYLTTIDNSRKNSLRFKDEKLTIYLKNSAQIFEAEFIKSTEDSKYLSVGNKLVFNYKKEDYFFTIVSIEEDEYTAKVTALGIALEASNSIREKYDADRTYTIAEYINKFDFEKMLTIRLNQISDRELKVSLSEESFLQRIYSLADLFNAEIMILPVLNDDRSIKQIAIDIYKKDEGDQGIGDYHPEIRLRYGKNISTVKRTVDIMQLRTAIKPIGNNGLNLIGYQVDIKDKDNKQLYYSTEQSGYIYAPQSRDRFPSNKTGNNSNDFYIEYTKTYNTDSKSELAKLGLADLKVDSEPKISYEVDTFHTDLNIGDTIRIDDSAYTPNLMLEARVTKLEICFTDPTKNKITFSNFIELKSEIDPALIAKMQELAEQNKVYNAQILTDNTVVFKNNQGETTLIARVLDGIKDITDTLTITWLKGDIEVGNGKNLRVSATDINGVQTYRFNAFKDGNLIAQTQISVADVVDGVDGQPGRDGITYYTWLKYADSPTSGMSDSPTGKTYIGLAFNKTTPNESNNYSDYQWSLIKGADGVQGPPGTNGQTTYVWLKYADNASGSGMSDNPTGKSYIGFAYNKTTVAESTNPSDYTWSKIEGPQGVPGADGADGENAINAYLTNENITLKADTQGNLKSGQLALASGQMVVVDGPNIVTNGISYSVVSQTGCVATIDSTGNYRLTALNADSASAIFRASYKGVSLQKTFSINKLYDAAPGQNGTNGQDGKSPIAGYLTNETFIIQTNEDGSLNSESLGNANGYFNIYQGDTKITNGVTYSIVSQTGVNVTLNAETGNYKVNSMSADFGTAIFKAIYNKVEIQKQLMVVKNKSAIGVVVADTPPEKPMTGQLWKNTGTNNEYTYNTTYYYTGSDWEIYLFYASNIKADNLAALSANMGTLRTGKMQSNDNLVSFDLDNKQLYMRLNNSPSDTYYGGVYSPGIKSQFWLTPTIFKYQHLEQPEQNGYYESGYADDGFYVADRSQGVKLRSCGLDFGNNIVLSYDYVFTDYKEEVNLPHGLTGKLRRVGKVVTLTIPRQVIDWTVKAGEYIEKSEKIPFGFRPIDEVTVMINRFSGVEQPPIALHIDSYGNTYLTSSGNGVMAFTGTCSWVTK